MANIVITGANRGIGYHFVERALELGHRVAALDLETENLYKLRSKFGENLLIFNADVRDETAMQSAVDGALAAFGSIDAAIHNACVCPFVSERDCSLDVYAQTFDVNYYGALRLAKCVLPAMRAQKRGRVLFVSSGVGVTGFSGLSAYASTKGALEALSKCLALECAADGVNFHIVHPPLTRTRSASPLPVPDEFKADPKNVGRGLAERLFKKRFIVCHSASQKLQTLGCYLFPVKMGRLLAKMTARAVERA